MATTEQRTGFRLPWAAEARPGASSDAKTPPDPDSPPVAEDETIADPTTPEATEMQEATTDPRSMSWPESDSRADDDPMPDTPAESPARVAIADPSPARPRRENLLVTGLVRAMRDAAVAAREETAARFADEAKSRVESIHTRAAEEAAELRKQAETEIVEIRDWSKAEMARIREETDQRIAGRKQHLESEIERHGAHVEHLIERVEGAVADFERQMEGFFVQLMAEDDPARLAGLAEQLPEAPSLDLDDLDRAVANRVVPDEAYAEGAHVDRAPDADADGTPAEGTFADAAEPAFPTDILDANGAAAAEAAASADLDASDEDDMIALPGDEENAIPDDDVARRLDAFTVKASAADTTTSQLAVVGLVSVASIAGFKRALAKTQGVRSVTVASGPSGDFIFTVGHDPETELRSIVPALDGFSAVITGDADGVLTVTASDPESAH
ncbi:MAG: hypothetical protein L0227_01110 [Chloroflexi bacterium]|nr:hypothetical protein [Chloroflexota bacterium]